MVAARFRARAAAMLEGDEGRDIADALAADETDPYAAATDLVALLDRVAREQGRRRSRVETVPHATECREWR